MRIFRLFLCSVLLSFISLLAEAQDSGSLAAAAYAQANYDDAAQLYDMAASLAGDSASKTKYYDMAKKSRECKSLTSRAASLYSAGSYDEARPLYSRILSMNPADKTAKSRIASIDSHKAKQKAAAKLNKVYAEALKSVTFSPETMDVTKLEEFIRKNPKDSRCELLRSMVAHLGSSSRVLSVDDVEYYLSAGKEFLTAGNIGVAAYLFDCAASFADVDGIYYKALTYGKGTKGYTTLMAIAAASGHDEAKKLAAEMTYDKAAAKDYLYNLRMCQNSFDAAFFVLLNQDNYYISGLRPIDYVISHLSADPKDFDKYDDSKLYHIATSGNVSDWDLRSSMVMAAAIKGNADAMAEYARAYAKEEYEDALYLFAWAGGVKEAENLIKGKYNRLNEKEVQAFVKLISGQAITDDEAFTLHLEACYGSALDYHEGLYATAVMCDSKYRFSEFKKYWKSARNKVYDAAYIETLKADLAKRPGEYYVKVLKVLSKINVGEGLYAETPVHVVAEILPTDNFHRTKTFVKTHILNK